MNGPPPQDRPQVTKAENTKPPSQSSAWAPPTAIVQVEVEIQFQDKVEVHSHHEGGNESTDKNLTAAQAPADIVRHPKGAQMPEITQPITSRNQEQASLNDKEATPSEAVGATGSVNKKGKKSVKKAAKKGASVDVDQQLEYRNVRPNIIKEQQSYQGSADFSKAPVEGHMDNENNVTKSPSSTMRTPAASTQPRAQSSQAAFAIIRQACELTNDQQEKEKSVQFEQPDVARQSPAIEAPRPLMTAKGALIPVTPSISERFFPTFPQNYRWPARAVQGPKSGSTMNPPRTKQTENIPPKHEGKKGDGHMEGESDTKQGGRRAAAYVLGARS